MKTIFTFLILSLFCSISIAQELEPPAEQKTEEVGSLGYGASDELDTDALTQRVDDLTEVVNTHTSQIGELDKRLTALENSKVSLASKSTKSRTRLKSTLNPVGKVRSWGSATKYQGGGSTGNPVAIKIQPSLLSSRIVSVSEPVVTSVEYGQPTVTSVQVSEPVRYEIQASAPAPVVVQQPQIVRSSPVAMAPLPASPAPRERRDVVRMPVARVTTENVRYEAISGSDCPGGVCPTSGRVNRGGFLGTRLGSRLGKFVRGGQ